VWSRYPVLLCAILLSTQASAAEILTDKRLAQYWAEVKDHTSFTEPFTVLYKKTWSSVLPIGGDRLLLFTPDPVGADGNKTTCSTSVVMRHLQGRFLGRREVR
jgi:hypothetical protein